MKGWCLVLFLLMHSMVGAQPMPVLKEAQALLDSGITAYRQSEHDHALMHLKAAIRSVSSYNDTASQQVLIKSYNNIGNIYADQGNNPLALENYQRSLAIAEKIHDRSNIAHVNKNIGALYISWQRLNEAIDYYKRSEQIALELGDDRLLADCYNNEGTVYEQQQQYDKALAIYKKAHTYYEKLKQPEGVAMSLSNIAIVYKYQKNYPAALSYNKQALEIAAGIDDKWTMAATLNNIGNLYGELGDRKQAIAYCDSSITLARSIGAMQIVIAAYESLAAAAAHQGDFKNAYQYFRAYANAKDSFINTESTRQLSELQVKYETQQQQTENEQLRYKNKLSTLAKNKAQKETFFIACLAIGLLAFSAIVFWLVYKNRMMRAKAQEQQMLNRTIYEVEQKERMRIARDLHDSIGQMMVVAKMQLMALPDPERQSTVKTENLLDEAIREVREIAHNLVPEGLNFGLFNALEELCLKVNAGNLTKVELNIREDAASYKFSKEHALSVYRIVQEVIGNMLKHAQAPLILIDLRLSPIAFIMDISDTGTGFDLAILKTATGMGWKNISARVSLLNGDIDVQSGPGKGTQIQITIPR